MADLLLEGVRKVFPGGVVAVESFDLEVAHGEFIVLVGPSGCGKTTTLRMIAGLTQASEGRILVDGQDVTEAEPRDRDIAMVFQNYALYPHMSVYDNIAFGLKMHRCSKEEIKSKVYRAAEALDLLELLDRKPRSLSGGQRQRVAMGRAIVRDPKVFLMDEPLSNLDAKLRVQMRSEIARLHRELGTTVVYVTHDQTEAMTLGDRIVVMNKGEVLQVASPQELYERPANRFVAEFIGVHQMNIWEAELRCGDCDACECEGYGVDACGDFDAERIDCGTCRADGDSSSEPFPCESFPCGVEGSSKGAFLQMEELFLPLAGSRLDSETSYELCGARILTGVRPEDIEVLARVPQEGGCLSAVVESCEMLGADTLLHCVCGHLRLTCRTGSQRRFAPGGVVYLVPNVGKMHFFDAETGEALVR